MRSIKEDASGLADGEGQASTEQLTYTLTLHPFVYLGIPVEPLTPAAGTALLSSIQLSWPHLYGVLASDQNPLLSGKNIVRRMVIANEISKLGKNSKFLKKRRYFRCLFIPSVGKE